MIILTKTGHSHLLKQITDSLTSVHLFVEKGQLQDHGYEPIKLDPSKWTEGEYAEEIQWTFEAGDVANVLGYYVVGSDGTTTYSEAFAESYEIQHKGDLIGVSVKLDLFGRRMEKKS